MKKRQFLAPLAISIAALLGTNAKVDALPHGHPTIAQAVASTALPSPSSFVIERSAGVLAQQSFHTSHVSHASHESHSSHVSHRSSY